MNDRDTEFEHILTVLETSRLPRQKRHDFALFLLDASTEDLLTIAAQVRADEDSFEILVLNALSTGKVVKGAYGEERFLTYEQLMIKDAMTQAK